MEASGEPGETAGLEEDDEHDRGAVEEAGGLAGGQAARMLFGLAIILVVLFEPAGLVGLGNRIKNLGRRRPGRGTSPTRPGPDSQPTPSHTPAQGSTT